MPKTVTKTMGGVARLPTSAMNGYNIAFAFTAFDEMLGWLLSFFGHPENKGKISFTMGKWVITIYLWIISKITLEFLMVTGKIQGEDRVKFLLLNYSSIRAAHILISNIRHINIVLTCVI